MSKSTSKDEYIETWSTLKGKEEYALRCRVENLWNLSSWTLAKSQKCSNLGYTFKSQGLSKSVLPYTAQTLPYAHLDSLFLEFPVCTHSHPLAFSQSLIVSQLPLQFLKTGTGDDSIQSTKKGHPAFFAMLVNSRCSHQWHRVLQANLSGLVQDLSYIGRPQMAQSDSQISSDPSFYSKHW